MKSLACFLIFAILSLSFLAQAKLLLPRNFKASSEHPSSNQRLLNISVTTQCNPIDVSVFSPNVKFAWSGYAQAINSTNSAFGFMFYGSQQAQSLADLVNYPVLIWFQGGPGSSSQFGNFKEMGPMTSPTSPIKLSSIIILILGTPITACFSWIIPLAPE